MDPLRGPFAVNWSLSMSSTPSLFEEIESHLKHGSSAQRIKTLHRVTDLFLEGAKSYAEEQVALFDEVMEHLVEEIEGKALVQLSRRLAPVDNAPVNVISRLARHDEIQISGPVLEQSNRLADRDLVEIANTKSQAHLAAIAGRRQINAIVTDVLVRRGNSNVARKVAANDGALFSDEGFGKLVQRCMSDEHLAELVAFRSDIPPHLFKNLVSRASEAVKKRLLANSDPAMQERIKQLLPMISDEVANAPSLAPAHDAGRSAKTLLKDDPALLKTRLHEFASARNSNETIATLANLTEIPREIVKHMMQHESEDGILILCKASGLGWPTVKAVLATRPGVPEGAEPQTEFNKYLKLSAESAQRVLRFLKARKAMSDTDLNKLLAEA
jgi:uncharacterized protein (DUF2336 family)